MIVDSTYVGSATASFQGLGNSRTGELHQPNRRADASVQDQLQPPLDLVTVSQEQELHKLNSRTKGRSFIMRIA